MKILLGMSGGIDSTYSALKLKSEGHEVVGAVLKMHEHTETDEASRAARELGIPIYEIDCSDEFDKVIKGNFVTEYTNGRTPNPCIICNEKIKFARLYDFAMKNGFDKIATGHYAKIVETKHGDGTRYAVSCASDSSKDQSYMLYRLPQQILASLVFPLSESDKVTVRENAREAGVYSADRPDSQEICFLPDGNYTEFVEARAGKCPEGNFIDSNGKILGRHKGIIHYTVGQRKGLGIALGERMFVTHINSSDNTVTLEPVLNGKYAVKICEMIYSGMDIPRDPITLVLTAKLRYTAPKVPVKAHLSPDGSATLEFDSPVKAAPGQSAVLYSGDTVMCGGFIL